MAPSITSERMVDVEETPRWWMAAAIPLLVIAVLVLGDFMFLRPSLAEFERVRAERADAERVVATLEARQEERSRALSADQLFSSEDRARLTGVSVGGDLPGTLAELSAHVRNVGATISNATVSADRLPTDLPPSLRSASAMLLTVTLDAADARALKEFLHAVAASSRMLDVVAVQFTPEASRAILRIRAYAFPV